MSDFLYYICFSLLKFNICTIYISIFYPIYLFSHSDECRFSLANFIDLSVCLSIYIFFLCIHLSSVSKCRCVLPVSVHVFQSVYIYLPIYLSVSFLLSVCQYLFSPSVGASVGLSCRPSPPRLPNKLCSVVSD